MLVEVCSFPNRHAPTLALMVDFDIVQVGSSARVLRRRDWRDYGYHPHWLGDAQGRCQHKQMPVYVLPGRSCLAGDDDIYPIILSLERISIKINPSRMSRKESGRFEGCTIHSRLQDTYESVTLLTRDGSENAK